MANWVPYDQFKLRQYNGNALDFDTDAALKLMLVTSGYTPNRATHDFKDDLGATEVSGSNYTAGGTALANKTLAIASNIVTFDADDVTFTQHASGFANARFAILYKDSGVASTSPLVAYADLTIDRGNVEGDLVLRFPDGIIAT